MRITREMAIQEIVIRCPEAIPVFERYGLGCCGCLAAEFESLEAVATIHRVRLGDLLRDLNALRHES